MSDVDCRATSPGQWCAAAAELRAEGYTRFCFLLGCDEIGRADTISVTLRLLGPAGAAPVELTTQVPRDGGTLPTLRSLWPAAGWAERALAEGFGISIDGGDPRPLLLHAGPAAPLRKEQLLPRRQEPWPGAKEDPAEGRSRRRLVPPGVPDPGAASVEDVVATAYGTGRGRR